MQLSAITAYPVKSLPGISLERARVEPAGLAHDRRWMLVDPQGVCVTQRDEPRMSQAQVRLVDDGDGSGDGYEIRVDAGTLVLPRHHDGPPVPVRVFSSRFEAVVHREGSELVSQWLGRPLRLVHLPDRLVRPAGSGTKPRGRVSTADEYPYLLIGEASLADLNERIAGPVMTMARFRPNLVITGSPPYVEDDWSRVEIGGLPFIVAQRCERCVLTTIDPLTGTRGREPLQTLATYRRPGKKVIFGVHLLPEPLDGERWLTVGSELRPLDG